MILTPKASDHSAMLSTRQYVQQAQVPQFQGLLLRIPFYLEAAGLMENSNCSYAKVIEFAFLAGDAITSNQYGETNDIASYLIGGTT